MKQGMSHTVLISGSNHNRIAIINKTGDTLWELPRAVLGWEEINDADLLESGQLLLAVRKQHLSCVICLQVLAEGFKTIWQYTVPDGGENHTCQPLSDGGILLAEAYADFVRLVELDAAGNVRKTLGTRSQQLPGFTSPVPNSHLYLRQGYKTVEGHYLLAHFKENSTVELDENGRLVQRYPAGGFMACTDFVGNIVISGGTHQNISCFERSGKLLWTVQKDDLPGVFLNFPAAVSPMRNGNLLLANWGGHGGGDCIPVLEFCPSTKKVLWTIPPQDTNSISNVQLLDDLTKRGFLEDE